MLRKGTYIPLFPHFPLPFSPCYVSPLAFALPCTHSRTRHWRRDWPLQSRSRLRSRFVVFLRSSFFVLRCRFRLLFSRSRLSFPFRSRCLILSLSLLFFSLPALFLPASPFARPRIAYPVVRRRTIAVTACVHCALGVVSGGASYARAPTR